MRIGVICPSEIAFRRFMPALTQCDGIEYVGISVSDPSEIFVGANDNVDDIKKKAIVENDYKKALGFQENYGGKIFPSYKALITSDEIDAVYIPLPPALHYGWAKLALQSGKHVLVEKPSTTCLNHSLELVNIAKENNLALHENYMFIYHDQLAQIKEIISSGKIGDVRLYRVSFGFPQRAANDFRYNKELGGGALIDAGGYTLKLAAYLLGNTAKVSFAKMNYVKEFDVDLYGSGVLTNDAGMVAQISYGMANQYKCELEVWGSTGTLYTNRILTAPVGFIPTVTLKIGNETTDLQLSADDTFKKSIMNFRDAIFSDEARETCYGNILKQAELMNDFKEKAIQE